MNGILNGKVAVITGAGSLSQVVLRGGVAQRARNPR